MDFQRREGKKEIKSWVNFCVPFSGAGMAYLRTSVSAAKTGLMD